MLCLIHMTVLWIELESSLVALTRTKVDLIVSLPWRGVKDCFDALQYGLWYMVSLLSFLLKGIQVKKKTRSCVAALFY